MITGSETTLLFETNNQMDIPNKTVSHIVNEGISKVTNIPPFDKDTLQEITENIRRPEGRVPDPNYIALVPLPVLPLPLTTILTRSFVFGVKYQKRFLIAFIWSDYMRQLEEIWMHPIYGGFQSWGTLLNSKSTQKSQKRGWSWYAQYLQVSTNHQVDRIIQGPYSPLYWCEEYTPCLRYYVVCSCSIRLPCGCFWKTVLHIIQVHWRRHHKYSLP